MNDQIITENEKKTSINFTNPQVACVDIEVTLSGIELTILMHPAYIEESFPIFYFSGKQSKKAMLDMLHHFHIKNIIMAKKTKHWEKVFRYFKKNSFDITLTNSKNFDKVSSVWRKQKDSIFRTINPNAAGIDIGAKHHWVCVPSNNSKNNVRRFETFTSDLQEMVQWLKENNVDSVAMESTGVYWIPAYEIIEQSGIEVYLVNAQHVKNVPGRTKTDNLDCQWIQRLHTFGLLSASFRPEDKIVKIRTLSRHRNTIIADQSRAINRMHKSLELMNIKLKRVIKDITGVSGLKIIKAIIAGDRDVDKLARLANYRVKASHEQIVKSLEGNYRTEHIFTLEQNLNYYEYLKSQIIKCDLKIESLISEMDKVQEIDKQMTFSFFSQNNSTYKTNPQDNEPIYDARTLLKEITGVDLVAIDGLGENTAQTILFEIGLDMSKWPTAKHFVSWLNLAPNDNTSGDKKVAKKKIKTKNKAANALRQCASSLKFSKTALGAFFRKIQSKGGYKKAVVATAKKLAVIIYTMLKNKTEYVRTTEEEYLQKNEKYAVNRLKRNAKKLGYELVPIQ